MPHAGRTSILPQPAIRDLYACFYPPQTRPPQGQEVRLAKKEPVAKHEPAAMKEPAMEPAAAVKKETQASCRRASLPPSPPLLTVLTDFTTYLLLTYF